MGDDDVNINEILRRVESPYRRWVIWIGHLAVMLVVGITIHTVVGPSSSFGMVAFLWAIALMAHASILFVLNRRDRAVLHALGYVQSEKPKRDFSITAADDYPQRLTDNGELVYEDDAEAAELTYNAG